MLNRYYIGGGSHSHTHNHNTLEQRAPTDESVKLLREMEAAAKASIVETMSVGGNGFEGVIHIMRQHDMYGTTEARCVFSLNGRKLTSEASVKDWESNPVAAARGELIKRLMDETAKKIAIEILKSAWPK